MMCHSENEVIPRYANATPQPELSQTIIELDITPDAEDNALCPVRRFIKMKWKITSFSQTY